MSTTQPVKALIVGAGPVGLTMACELARHGVSCRIVDQADAPSTTSKALAVHSRTLEVLADVGVVDEVLARGLKVSAFNFYADGKALASVSTEDLDSPYPFTVILPQSETEKVLGARLTRAGVSVERGVSFTGLVQDKDGVTATLKNRAGQTEQVRVLYLLGCDGAHSAVRHALGMSFEGSSDEDVYALADVRLDAPLAMDQGHAFFGPEGPLLLLPLPGDKRARVICEGPRVQENPTLEFFQSVLAARAPQGTAISAPTWISAFRIARRLAPSYQSGRVFLAGDAAHIHSPIGGQGMNTGIQDAYNLAWKLALVVGGRGQRVLLDSYTGERRPIAAATIDGTDLAMKAVQLKGALAKELRNQAIRLLTSIEAVQRRLATELEELGISYRKSPIVEEHKTPLWKAHAFKNAERETPSLRDVRDFGSAPQAGDRAPEVEFGVMTRPGQARERLFPIIQSGKHTLLLFDGAASTTEGYETLDRIAHAVKDLYGNAIKVYLVMPLSERPEGLPYAGAVLLDPDGKLHKRYGAGSECMYLVRPDGYIAFRSQPAEEEPLLAYLEKVFIDKSHSVKPRTEA